MEKSNFRDWTLDKIDDTFGLRQVETLPSMEEWLAFEHTCDDYETRHLKRVRSVVNLGITGWNEVEVENKTITPIIELTEIDSREVSYFMERPISHTIGNYELSGVVDGLIASGFRSPKLPFFCLSEFKKEMTDSQPDGQALIAMLVTQDLNSDDFPVYGCYIVGLHWFSIVLKGKEYAISKRYSADDEGIFDIYRIMLGLKQRIHHRLKQNTIK